MEIIMRRRTSGFTLVELLVVVSIIALLITILLPVLGRARELTKQVACMANLSGISKGWMLYGNENRGAPPILPGIDMDNADWHDTPRMGDECTADALGEGGQQNLCLLVKFGVVSWGMFICPSTTHTVANRSGADRRYGLGEITNEGTRKSYCDYAIQVPYNYAGNNRNLCPLKPEMDGGIVILGDRGPSGNAWHALREWSPNHPKDGESVLYAAGNVKFSKDKRAEDDRNTAGWGGNNIYTGDRWDTSNPENPTLLQNGWCNPGWEARSSKDTVLYWWK